ncbi:MAG: ABC transporter ATP-binding protein, partial [Caulobacteraceae bacterium]
MTLTLDRPTGAEASLVEVKGLRHVYGKRGGPGLVVLDEVDLALKPGEIVGLLGRSGSGKSTLLRSIAGLITPTAGEIRVSDMPGDEDAHGVAMVFQSFALFPWLTVQKNVELGLEAQGVSAEARRTRSLAAIDLIGLDGFENAYPKELSGGMRQRVGLARALVVQPSVLLMDEPFSALDVLTAETLRTDLLDLWLEGRMPIRAILLVTHNIEEAVLMCDRILVFSSNPGKVIAEIKVDLPQPRKRLDPAFRALVDDIYARMTARPSGAPVSQGNFPGTGLGMSLTHVSSNTLSGMIEAIAAPPSNGKAELAELGRALQ